MAWSRISRHKRGYGAAWTRLRAVIMERDNYQCQACKREGKLTAARQVDHIIAKANGGTDDRGNLEALCIPHHQAKTAQESAEAQGKVYRPKVTIGLDGWPEG